MQGKGAAAGREGAVIHVRKLHLEFQRLRFLALCRQHAHRKLVAALLLGDLRNGGVLTRIKEDDFGLRRAPWQGDWRERGKPLAANLAHAPGAEPSAVKMLRNALG